jgi:hypothetical protein
MSRKIADFNLFPNPHVFIIWAIANAAECFALDDVLIRKVTMILGVSFSCDRSDRFTLFEPKQESSKRRGVHRDREGKDDYPKQSQSKDLLEGARWHSPTVQRLPWVTVETSPFHSSALKKANRRRKLV